MNISINMKVHGALLAVAIIYGASYSIAKTVMPEFIKPFGFILVRVTIATFIFFTISKLRGIERIKYKRDYIRLMFCGLFGVASNQLLFFSGLSMTSTISASVLMTSNPVIVLILSYFILNEVISRQKLIGILLGGGGAILLLLRGDVLWETGTFLGDFLILLNSASFGIYLILVKPLMQRYNAITVISWVFLFGLVVVVPFGFTEVLEVNWSQMPVSGWFSIGYIVFLTTVVAYSLNVWSLKFVNPTIVSYYIYLQPLFASLIALIFLKEHLDLKIILFAAMIFLGVYLVGRQK